MCFGFFDGFEQFFDAFWMFFGWFPPRLFGFDVLLDSTLHPWLCEVNSLPSLGLGGANDLDVDRGMLSALFRRLLHGAAAPGGFQRLVQKASDARRRRGPWPLSVAVDAMELAAIARPPAVRWSPEKRRAWPRQLGDVNLTWA